MTEVAHAERQERLAKFVEEYSALLRESLERQMYCVDRGTAGKIERFAQQLAERRSSPREIIEIHTASLTSVVKDSGFDRGRAYGEEARMLLFEVMGQVINQYRRLVSHGAEPRG